MKKTLPFVASLLWSGATLPAQLAPEALAEMVRRDPERATYSVAVAVGEQPQRLADLLAAAVRARPEQAPEMVATLLNLMPARWQEILDVTITTAPDRAVDVVAVAVSTLPAQAEEILAWALTVVPDDLRREIEALRVGGATVRGRTPGRFPAQSLRPEVVSASR